jgi:hypothetical protein
VACAAIAQAAPILRDVRTDLVKVKRIAADIIGTAVEADVNNASLTIATRAAIDMTIFGSSVPKLLSSARTLWTRMLRTAGSRIALLFPTVLKAVKAAMARGSIQRVLNILELWREMAAQHVLPFTHVVAFENVRDKPLPTQHENRIRQGFSWNLSLIYTHSRSGHMPISSVRQAVEKFALYS